MFGQTFAPVKILKTEGERIRSLQNPAKKMSKSGDEGIGLIDSPDEVAAKIKKAVTDSGSEIKYDPEKKPAISNLLTIYHLLSGRTLENLQSQYAGKSYVDFKNDLAEVVIEFLKPIRGKYNQLQNDLTQMEQILTKSEEKAKVTAADTLREVKQKAGLL